MRIRITLVGLLLLPLTTSLAVRSQQPPQECVLSDEDYKVFSAVVDGLGRPEDPEEAWKSKEILVSDLTAQPDPTESKWGPWGFRSNSNAAPAKETEGAFKLRAHDICKIEAKLQPANPYKLAEHDKVNKIFKKGGWKEFYKQYPNAAGYWDFSHPGYNKAGTEAVLYVGHYCGGLCGTGHLFFLTKDDDGQWRVKNRLMLWIS
jgi:hypothetical protein